MTPAIEVRGLTRRFGAFVAVNNLSFTVAPGEIFGFLGANGAGKSTTIRMLCGLLSPSSGSATVGGIDVTRDPEGVKRRIGYMSQRFSLYDRLTVDQNIRFFAGVYGIGSERLDARRRFVLEMAGLEGREHQLTSNLRVDSQIMELYPPERQEDREGVQETWDVYGKIRLDRSGRCR